MYAKFFLITQLFAGSFFVWRHLIKRRFERKPFLDVTGGPRANWHSAVELAVVYVALLWAITNLLPQFVMVTPKQPTTIELRDVALDSGIKLVMTIALTLLLVSGRRPSAAVGMTMSNLRNQLTVGTGGFFAAVIPMAIFMAISASFRKQENQHALLKLVNEAPNFITIAVVAGAAVVSAPLLEELIFRVILQGWLTTFFRPTLAIGTVAVLFSLVHGWRDGFALLPLALILGYVFDRRHSYLTVVVIHALFNATMLTLQLLGKQNSI